ncbi:MAG TPA: efflux transporter periplasmic adaptor subunit, partial [Halieaceae bacterium]|nr:efflux transporter periplasmic adaptor subunit [Halieaceae bacterium]
DYVYPSLDEKTRTLRIRLRFNNTAGMLKPNMFAQVFIEAGRGGDALMVPREAVIRTGSQDRVVLALGDGRFKSVAVRLGQLDEQYTQILEGLEEGDKVVVSAQFLLDSESSKSAGFMRMQLGDTEDSSMLETAADSHLQRTGADHD